MSLSDALFTALKPTIPVIAKVNAGVATPEELAQYEQWKQAAGAESGSALDIISSSDLYKKSLIAAQAEATRRQAQAQVKDVLNLRAAEERASRVVTLDDRQVNISIGGTADAAELQRRRQFANTSIGPRI